ncbi:hypothetical protein K3718_14245 [Leisingera aquaemixtae]|uniref:Uncharacterized protein n=1 Tax=Leisingera aquaemixtae TaxID=1396826 RepID=A0ABY5WGW6_9RHOB|nr:hypothetical protein [Leisingera aquaemixtae]UWQ40703.1 hypothetical protein K3718_14245 [Leisingera aquaemixtae]
MAHDPFESSGNLRICKMARRKPQRSGEWPISVRGGDGYRCGTVTPL